MSENTDEECWSIRVTIADHEANEFVDTRLGAEFGSEGEARAALAELRPFAAQDADDRPFDLIWDLRDPDGSIDDNVIGTPELFERLFGFPLAPIDTYRNHPDSIAEREAIRAYLAARKARRAGRHT